MESKTQVVVLGRNYTSLLGMIRAVGQAGCDVTVVRTVKKLPQKQGLKAMLKPKSIETQSKYVKKYLVAIESNASDMIKMLVEEFKDAKEKVILIPTDDFTSSSIDINQDMLKDKFLYPNIDNKPGAVAHIMDKDVQKHLAIEVGLDVAKGWISKRLPDGSYEIPDNIEYPCFTKPDISYLANKDFMKRCDSEEELSELLKKFAVKIGNVDCPILIEQYIDIEKEYGALGFCDGKTAVIPAITYKMKIGSGSHKGVTMLGQVIPRSEFKDLTEKLENFVKRTGFRGLFDIDLYQNGDVMYFNELNLRFGAFGYALTAAGINLPAMCIKYFTEGKPTDYSVSLSKSVRCLNDKVNLEDFSAGFISWDEYVKTRSDTDYRFVEADGDDGPANAFKKLERVARIKRFIKK